MWEILVAGVIFLSGFGTVPTGTAWDPLLDELQRGDIIVFDWIPLTPFDSANEIEMRGYIYEMQINPINTTWDYYTTASAIVEMGAESPTELFAMLGVDLPPALLTQIEALSAADLTIDGVPGKFDHCVMFIGKCSEVMATIEDRLKQASGDEVNRLNDAKNRVDEIWGEFGDVWIECEAIGEGVSIYPLVPYLKKALNDGLDIAVSRVPQVDEETIDKAVGFAVSKYGLPYDYFPSSEGSGWFDAVLDEGAYYCSELIWAAYYYATCGAADLNMKAYSNPLGNAIGPNELIYNLDVENVLMLFGGILHDCDWIPT